MKILFSARLLGLAVLLVSGAFFFCIENARAIASFGDGGKWAVCIGVADYEDPDLADLHYPRNDARDFAGVLEGQGGFDKVWVLTDDRAPKDPLYPSGKNIRKVLGDVGEGISRGDTVLLFFSGQGVTDPGGLTFLLPADAAIRNIPRTGIALDTVFRLIGTSEDGPRILIVDGARGEIWRKGPRLEPVYPDRYLRRGVSALFYAAKKGSFSHEDPEAPYGVFSRYLIEGLQGKADQLGGGNKDGFVSLMELGAYVEDNVHSWAVSNAKKQSPYIRIFESEAAVMQVARAGEFEEAPSQLAAVEPEAHERPGADASPPEVPKTIRVIPPASESSVGARKAPEESEELPGAQGKASGSDDDAIVLGAPAPSIDDVPPASPRVPTPEPSPGERPGTTAPTEPRKTPTEAPPETKAELTPEITPEAPAEAPAKPQSTAGPVRDSDAPLVVAPPAPSLDAPDVGAGGGEKAAAFETEQRVREDSVIEDGEAARVASIPTKKVEDMTPETAPPVPPPEPVTLRGQPTDLSHEGVQSFLVENDFYATCWTYNGDFCNPTGDFINAYVDNKDGTVTDRRTGLMWQKAGSPEQMPWGKASEYIKELNKEAFAGHTDWRLPTLVELASLMERSWLNEDVFIDPVFSSEQKYCWSSDTKGVERAWKSNFHLGFFLDFPMTERSSVRAVRALN